MPPGREPHSPREPISGEDPNPPVSAMRRIRIEELNASQPGNGAVRGTGKPAPRGSGAALSGAAKRPAKAPVETGQVGVSATGKPVVPARANPVALRKLSRLLQSDAPPTQAFSIVDRLVGSPYANPKVNTSAHDASARKTLEFALDLAETMFRYGAGALEVETSIIASTAALGLSNVDVDITNQSINLNYSPPDTVPYALLRVVRSWTNNYAGLALVHQLVSDIVGGGVTRQQSVDRLREITRSPKPFARWIVAGASGGFAALFVLFIGGSWQGALIAFASSLLAAQISKYGVRWHVPEFFSTAASSFVVTAIAILFYALDVPISPAIVVAGGILLLLPSARFVSSVQDAINGFPVTAAGRLFSATLVYASILTGIMGALVVSDLLNAPAVDLVMIDKISYPGWLLILLVVAAVILGAITEQSAHQLLLPTGTVALLGYLVMLGAQFLGAGDRLAPAIAATFIGMVARWVALRMGAPQLVIAVPAIVFLLPGLMIFRAMYGIGLDSADMTSGMIDMFNAFLIIMAIAGGVVFGDTLARPFTRGRGSNERKTVRRR